MRIFAVSDLHLDYSVNFSWLNQLSLKDYQEDILILAGDISDDVKIIKQCFELLALRFNHVLFVPGNHDLWVLRSDLECSLEKHKHVRHLAQDNGVLTSPLSIGDLSIVPILGWYDYTFGVASEKLRSIWMDYHACSWPEDFDDQAICHYFLAENEQNLDIKNKKIITFSHFLPRIDLMPSFIPAKHRILYPVLGSALIEKQIRRLGSMMHVYGHSHVNRQVKIDNLLYINNAFGYPSETMIAKKELICIFEA